MTTRSRSLRRLRSALAASAAALLAGCGPSLYEAYVAEHPGWEPALPLAPGGIAELVAALDAPDRVPEARVKLNRVVVLELGGQPWRSVDPASLRDQTVAPDAVHAVIALRDCQALKGGGRIDVRRVDTFLLQGGRVAAYDHSDFRADCDVDARFRAARGDLVAHEVALGRYVRREHGMRPVEIGDLYRRGLAYVEAGRLAEAMGVLRLGERAWRAAESQAEREETPKKREARARETQAERARLRRQLHQALGVELPAD